MDVAGEAMAEGVDFVLYRSSMAGWEPPNASGTVDDATRQMVLHRIIGNAELGRLHHRAGWSLSNGTQSVGGTDSV
jgi:hypothetical protein